MRKGLLGLGLLLILGLLSLGFVAGATAAAPQATVTMVFQVNATVPLVNKAVLGTFTMNFDPATERGTWSFQGTVDGQFATASGSGLCRVNSTVRVPAPFGGMLALALNAAAATPEVSASIDAIDSWNMPGIPRPALPAEATIRTVGNLSYVSYNSVANVPLAVSPPIAMPFQSGAYAVTTAGSGAQMLPTLPNTGSDPAGAPARATVPVAAVIVLGLAALLVMPLAVVARRGGRARRRPDTVAAAH